MRRITLLVCALCCAQPALANDRPVSERITDGIGFSLLSTVGAAAGAGAGVLIASETCHSDSDDDSCVGFLLLGAAGGLVVGFLAGGALFDGLSDGDGSYLAASGGVALGLVVGLATARDGGMSVDGPLLAVLGSGLGYALFDAAEDVQPSAMVLPDGEGGMRYSAGFGGTF